MTAVTASMVKELRERTGLGMMDCKKALTEADGDMERAIEDLRKRSALKAAKKADRTAAEGLLGVRVADDGSRGSIVEVNIETDFAAKNDKFIAFVDQVADAALAAGAVSVDQLMTGELEDTRSKLVQEIGENISVRRVATLDAPEGARVYEYTHTDQRKAALVVVSGGDAELARGVAMHVTAQNPMVLRGSDVPADVQAKEREIYTAQAADSGKPPEIVEKMVEGRMRKFLSESSLLEQPYVRDPDQKVGKMLSSAGAECHGFVRFEVGEGIERAAADFAAEVAEQVQKAKSEG